MTENSSETMSFPGAAPGSEPTEADYEKAHELVRLCAPVEDEWDSRWGLASSTIAQALADARAQGMYSAAWTDPTRKNALEELVGPGKRYRDAAHMAEDVMRWHDEAQAEKMHAMELEVEVRRLRSVIERAKGVVLEQAEDLWSFTAETASEAYLQGELRRLHGAIEGDG